MNNHDDPTLIRVEPTLYSTGRPLLACRRSIAAFFLPFALGVVAGFMLDRAFEMRGVFGVQNQQLNDAVRKHLVEVQRVGPGEEQPSGSVLVNRHGLPVSAEAIAERERLKSLETIIARIRDGLTTPSVNSYTVGGEVWAKVKHEVVDVLNEISETDSQAYPYTANVEFVCDRYWTVCFETKELAEKYATRWFACNSNKPMKGPSKYLPKSGYGGCKSARVTIHHVYKYDAVTARWTQQSGYEKPIDW